MIKVYRHVHPQISDNDMEYIYTNFKSMCEEIKISLKEFKECRNSIYTFSTRENSCNSVVRGFIAIAKTTINKTLAKKLEYYCKSNQILYEIRAIHIESGKFIDDLETLINSSLVDKNDGFVIMQTQCPVISEMTEIIMDMLEDKCGFELVQKDDYCYLIKKPTLHG